ncbi:MAG TPA: hypothetical protein H9900_06250 [Candidatus Monoglobus merdigallinarum]|uniref:DUF3794 domain-containing protein n=1 Tax=Candidatus Monoglobus merdigallinarum TaxID=2838698 RepID=A0A9D1TN37_9FIRM|nr:hypothetical protein [Candidatus Monoglobus merdigallinarum]
MSNKNDCRRQRGNESCGCTAEDVNAQGNALDAAFENTIGAERRAEDFSDPICISVDKVYDACRERNCIVDARVYFTPCNQEIIENSINVKLKKAEIIWVYTDIEPVLYNSGYYSIDIKYFIDVTIEAFAGMCDPEEIHGLVTYDKRIILYGSEGQTKSFKSTLDPGEEIEHVWKTTNLPKVTVEVVDPIALTARLAESDCCCNESAVAIPSNICSCYGEELVVSDNVKKVLVSLGIFSIVRIERNVQILVDAVDFCIPEKHCTSSTDQEPCELFNSIRFPIDEFFPPSGASNLSSDDNGSCCSCGCSR